MRSFCRSARGLLGLVAVALPLGGCGGGEYGESVAVPQQQRLPVYNGLRSGETVRLPDGTGFNVADAQRQSTGTAVAKSTVDAAGTATCSVAVTDGGSGRAEFQLGQVVYNKSAETVEATVVFDCTFNLSVEGERTEPGIVGLKLYVQDSDQKMLHKVTLAGGADSLGEGSREGRESPSFNFTLEPGYAYTLVAAGKVEIPEKTDPSAVSAELTVKTLAIELRAR